MLLLAGQKNGCPSILLARTVAEAANKDTTQAVAGAAVMANRNGQYWPVM